MLTFSDCEYLIIFIVIAALFCLGLKKKAVILKCRPLVIDLNMSSAIKGIACVFILMGHYGSNNFDLSMPWTISKAVWMTTANIALVWFMFFSGYGLSLKDYSDKKLSVEWINRAKKIYLPLLLTCIIAVIVYACLPDIYTSEEKTQLHIPDAVGYLHHFQWAYTVPLLKTAFGLFDWYVFCILIFYSLFYLSIFLSRMFKFNSATPVLAVLMLIYYVIAYFYFGEQHAHWFRFPWAFLLGHIVACGQNNSKWINFIVLAVFVSLFVGLRDKIQLCSSIMAILSLYIVSVINSRYEMNSRALLFMGSISFFFYLCHTRIGYPLMMYAGYNSIILWIFITVLLSFILKTVYSKTFKRI